MTQNEGHGTANANPNPHQPLHKPKPACKVAAAVVWQKRVSSQQLCIGHSLCIGTQGCSRCNRSFMQAARQGSVLTICSSLSTRVTAGPAPPTSPSSTSPLGLGPKADGEGKAGAGAGGRTGAGGGGGGRFSWDNTSELRDCDGSQGPNSATFLAS